MCIQYVSFWIKYLQYFIRYTVHYMYVYFFPVSIERKLCHSGWLSLLSCLMQCVVRPDGTVIRSMMLAAVSYFLLAVPPHTCTPCLSFHTLHAHIPPDSSTQRLLRFLNRAALPCPWQPTTPTSTPELWLLFIPLFHPYFVLLSDSASCILLLSVTKNTATAFVLPKVVWGMEKKNTSM